MKNKRKGKILYQKRIKDGENAIWLSILPFACDEKDNNNIPIFISIRIYKEYEEIEIDALDYCNTIPSHDGFLKYKNVFHQSFPKNLSNKVKRIKNDRIQKRENLLKEDK